MYNIQYDIPIEVTQEQYSFLKIEFVGALAHRYDKQNNKWWIKVWLMGYAPFIKKYLEKINIHN